MTSFEKAPPPVQSESVASVSRKEITRINHDVEACIFAGRILSNRPRSPAYIRDAHEASWQQTRAHVSQMREKVEQDHGSISAVPQYFAMLHKAYLYEEEIAASAVFRHGARYDRRELTRTTGRKTADVLKHALDMYDNPPEAFDTDNGGGFGGGMSGIIQELQFHYSYNSTYTHRRLAIPAFSIHDNIKRTDSHAFFSDRSGKGARVINIQVKSGKQAAHPPVNGFTMRDSDMSNTRTDNFPISRTASRLVQGSHVTPQEFDQYERATNKFNAIVWRRLQKSNSLVIQALN